MASQIFENFAEAVTEGEDGATDAPAAAAPAPASAAAGQVTAMSQVGAGTWVSGLVVAAIVLFALFG